MVDIPWLVWVNVVKLINYLCVSGVKNMTVAQDRILIYPDSDGQPMADNTLQFRWIVLIKENLECE